MTRLQVVLLALFIAAIAFDHGNVLVNADISKSMYMDWGNGKAGAFINGDNLQLALDQTSGSRAKSKRAFLFGSFQMLIKLVPGNSAGTVSSFYLSSDGDSHDEIDFEFLGNVSGQPYIIHTNLFAHGQGNREQQFYVWFDPTAAYHNYTIFWGPAEIVWYIDSVPIRVFRNYQNKGVAYPNAQGMRAYTSIYDGDSWATQGGRIKINWSYAPFIAKFRQFRPKACFWNGAVSISQCATSSRANWWTSPIYNYLNNAKTGQMKWARDNYLINDYCKKFNGQMPRECSLDETS